MKLLRTHLCCLTLLLLVTPARAQEKKPSPKGIDPATVAAYKKLGAEYGTFKFGGRGLAWSGRDPDKNGLRPDELPGFWFRRVPEARLPAVSVPFGLDFNPFKMTNASLKNLAHLKNLRVLDLTWSTKLTAAGLKELAGLENLTDLYLPFTFVKDADLKELAPLKNLAVLDLRYTRITDAGLKELAGLKKLSQITYQAEKITDATLRHLREAGLLHAIYPEGISWRPPGPRSESDKDASYLDLSYTKVTDAGLKELAVLTNLDRLDLLGTQVTGSGLKELAGLKKLATLSLLGSGATDGGLKGIAGLENLRTLSLAHTNVTDAGLKELVRLKSLRALYLFDTNVTDAGLKELVRLNKLTELLLQGTKVTDAGVADLRKTLPKCEIVVKR